MNRHLFYTELLPELRAKGHLLVVISHDDRYFHIADRVICMESGQIIDNVNFEKLHPKQTEKSQKKPSARDNKDQKNNHQVTVRHDDPLRSRGC